MKKLTEAELRRVIRQELEEGTWRPRPPAIKVGELPIFETSRFKTLQNKYPKIFAYLENKKPEQYNSMLKDLNDKNQQRAAGSGDSLDYQEFMQFLLYSKMAI